MINPSFSCPICERSLDCSKKVAEETLPDGEYCGIRQCLCGFCFTWPMIINPQGPYLSANKEDWLKKYGSIARGETFHDRHLNYLEEVAVIKDYINSGKLLDVGCHSGWLLGYLADCKRYELEGVEPSSVLAEIIHDRLGINVHNCFVGDLKDREDFFDGITVIDVIEHINPEDIKLFISSISKSLKPKGFLFIKTPNGKFTRIKGFIADLFPMAFRKNILGVSDVWDAKEHVIHWSYKSLKKALEMADLKIIAAFVPPAGANKRWSFDGGGD